MRPNFLSNQYLPDWKEMEKSLVKRTRDKEKVSSIWKMEDTFCRFMYMYFSIVQEDFQGAHPAPHPKSCNVTYDFAGASYSFTIYG